MPDCKNCNTNHWKNQYLMAQERFDRVLIRLTVGTIIAFTISVLCLFATIYTILKVQAFIENFEYVEETQVEIEQDSEGENFALITNESEVDVQWDKKLQ